MITFDWGERRRNAVFLRIGTIQKTPGGKLIIRFEMGGEQDAIGHILLPTKGAIAQPNLFPKDCVLVRQNNRRGEFWVPGIVLFLPSPGAQPPPQYTVTIYTPSANHVRSI